MKLLAIALAFVLTVASCAVLADKPPDALIRIVSANKVVHDQKCDFHQERSVECVILYDNKRDIVWLVLFDENEDGLSIYRVVAVHKKKESTVWCRQDVCI